MRGTGELPGVSYEDVNYEGYGPGGVAIFMVGLTDNKNRTVAELRHLLSKHGGNLGESGCVGWMFDRKGYIVVEKAAAGEDKLLGIALGAGAEDLKEDGDSFEIITAPEEMEGVRAALEAAGIPMTTAEISMIPQNYVKLEGKNAQTMLKLMEALEDHEDIQNVYSNFDIDESEFDAEAS
jgi:YebC/PmpR family DNA-binding regulatory protein